MESWLNPGLRWLLIIVTACNLAASSAMLVSWMAARFLVSQELPGLRHLLASSARREFVLFTQNGAWLAFSLSLRPVLWPALLALGVVAFAVSFALSRELFVGYLRVRPLIGDPSPYVSGVGVLTRLAPPRRWLLLLREWWTRLVARARRPER